MIDLCLAVLTGLLVNDCLNAGNDGLAVVFGIVTGALIGKWAYENLIKGD